MDHEAHIRLINAHAKGDGSHDHIDVLHQEVILCLGTGRRIQTSMIGRCLDVVSLQDGRQFLHLLPRQTVNDAALPLMLLDELDNVLINILCLWTHLIIEVGSVE